MKSVSPETSRPSTRKHCEPGVCPGVCRNIRASRPIASVSWLSTFTRSEPSPGRVTVSHATAGGGHGPEKARALHDADEGVADGAQLVVHARAPAPVDLAPLERPSGHDVRVGGGAALTAAAIPDHLHVLGVGE